MFLPDKKPPNNEFSQRYKILVTIISANMIRFYQPLDLPVNGYAKKFMSRKFNSWCTDQINLPLEKGDPIDKVDVKLRLSLMKPLHAEWITNFYNHMTTPESEKSHRKWLVIFGCSRCNSFRVK